MRNQWLVAGLAMAVVSMAASSVKADFTVSLHVQSVTASTATLDIKGLFLGGSGDTIQSIQISVQGSDDALTNVGTDFNRFHFTSALPDFSATDFDASTGILLLFADDPVNGPFLLPSQTEYALGTLTISLAGLPGDASLLVTLAGGVDPLHTDAAGEVGGVAVDSFAGAGLMAFGQPNGVRFTTVPEPGSGVAMSIGGGLALMVAGWRRKRARLQRV